MSGIHLKLKRLSPSASEDFRTVKILNTFHFNKVLDIGANTGQFAESLIDFGFKGEIISFEPTMRAYNELKRRAKRHKNWKVNEKCAIGDFDGNIEINVSRNSLFSSIKKIRDDYSAYNMDSHVISKENVDIHTLDYFQNKCFNPSENIFLKIDTQGFEQEVLKGASEVLNYVNGIKIEIPLQPIYDGVKWEIAEIMNYFKERNFKCISINEVAVNNVTGIVHEVDAIFIREELLLSSTM
jgi:FkbM family methyltransferase